MCLVLSLLAAILAFPVAGLDLSEVQQRGTLKVLAVVIEEEPAFLSLKPGTPPGFDYEILEGFGKLQKLKLEIVSVPSYDALIPALLKGRGDVIAGGGNGAAAGGVRAAGAAHPGGGGAGRGGKAGGGGGRKAVGRGSRRSRHAPRRRRCRGREPWPVHIQV